MIKVLLLSIYLADQTDQSDMNQQIILFAKKGLGIGSTASILRIPVPLVKTDYCHSC